ncbi:serine/threonine-protein kinase [Amycolatopsis sp. NPDC059657]|uniref:serine/threonine-protein kinase n=1 Tax=Amycolatopsis sp. NPDC059657 TaxID=3346899 RepID=UPI00366BA1BC
MTSTRAGHVVGGRYRLDAELGSGGFGCVWRARDLTLDVDVAIKELRLPPGMSPEEHAELLARATREARNAARLRTHENIVAIHDIVHEDDLRWIVMDLINGRSMAEHLATDGPLPADRAATVTVALLTAIGAAHRQGVVHRDIKPANVMLAYDGKVLLTDFGTAIHHTDTSLTATGMVIGSPEYTAPERLRGTDGLPASDLFSLGATLYQAVEGVSPFRRDTPTATLTAVLLDQPPAPRRAGPLTHLITRLLDKDPNTRPTVHDTLAMTGGTTSSSTQTPTSVIRHPTTVSGTQEGTGWRPVAEVLTVLTALLVILVFCGRGFDGFGPTGPLIGFVINAILTGALCAGAARLAPPHAERTTVRTVSVAAFVIGGLDAFLIGKSTIEFAPVLALFPITVALVAALFYVSASRKSRRTPK